MTLARVGHFVGYSFKRRTPSWAASNEELPRTHRRGPLQLNGALKMRLRHANRPVQRYILPARPPDCRRRRRASTKLIMKTLKMRGGTVAQRRPLHKLLRRRCALAIASSASLVAAVVAAVQVVPLPVQCDGSDGLGAAFRSSWHARL